MLTSTILPAAPLSALYDYWATTLHEEPISFAMAAPARSLARRLTEVERATTRLIAPPAVELVTHGRGVPIEAALRLVIWRDRGERLSGDYMACELQDFFYPYARGAVRPWRGWELLRAIDATTEHHGVQIVLDAPSGGDHFETVRLSDRLSES
ncbi:hypothetical protein [Agreia sp. Leaf244]|uniref:hypothetical protein n=1 Tax=Agreia sp. Leaf244 TaxID=1736305 RepID=UPI0012FA6FF5|nr:hypothetical protein [Agreia sp. Leaf244]